MNSYIVFLCEEMDHTFFFINMENALSELNFRTLYIVTNLSVYIKLRKLTKRPVIIVKRKEAECNYQNALYAKEYVEKSLSIRDTIALYKSCWNYFEYFNNLYNISLFCGSQGVRVAEIAMKDFCKSQNKKIAFFELSNISGKTFWDPEGSNASSYFYKHPEILKTYFVSEDAWNQWRDEYLEKNFKNHEVKQRVNIRKKSIVTAFYNRFSFLYTGLKLRKMDFVGGLVRYFRSKKIHVIYDSLNLQNEKFIFFPMQVAKDSQIILNSDIDLFEALDICANKAKKENLLLVVKLHPAENDVNVIREVLKLRRRLHFKVVDINTFLLIENAQKIITINSTVALESLIIGKQTEILGRSYYKFLNPDNVKQYVLGHLIDLDFFANKPFKKQNVKFMLDRFYVR